MGEPVWTDTAMEIPDMTGTWKNVFTGEMVRPDAAEDKPLLSLAQTLAYFPVALLVPADT